MYCTPAFVILFFGDIMIVTTNEINKRINENAQQFVAECENAYNQKIESAADIIVKNSSQTHPLVLISGPSGSGKTTTAIKLSHAIKKRGFNVCYISMDKYFKNFTDEERKLKRLNKIDLEAPERVDIELLNSELERLINGEEIDAPSYDFATNSRFYKGAKMARNGGFVIVEGIHALNPSVLGEVGDYSTKMYVSVRTRVKDSEGDKIHPSKIRLMRRILRDKLYRKREADETIKMYSHVQRGENAYVLPYKSSADIDIDTFLPYEPALYKNYIYNDLIALAQRYADVRDIVSAMNDLSVITEDIIPPDALLREFIGGSSLSY